MNDEAARQGRPASTSGAFKVITAVGREPTVEEIVARCREAAAAAGLSWLHDLVVEELDQLAGGRAA